MKTYLHGVYNLRAEDVVGLFKDLSNAKSFIESLSEEQQSYHKIYKYELKDDTPIVDKEIDLDDCFISKESKANNRVDLIKLANSFCGAILSDGVGSLIIYKVDGHYSFKESFKPVGINNDSVDYELVDLKDEDLNNFDLSSENLLKSLKLKRVKESLRGLSKEEAIEALEYFINKEEN